MPPLDKGAEGTGETSRTERAEVVRLIDDRVLRQGNFFIKSFLRDRAKIGTKKEEFRQNLLDGFDAGDFTKKELDDWLAEVDGWGKQRVHLFTIRPRTKDVKEARRKIDSLGLPTELDPASELPGEPSLACATYDGKTLRLSWALSSEVEIPAREKNHDKWIGRRLYRFKAYLVETRLRIFRFEVRFGLEASLAVLLTPLAISHTAEDRAAMTEKLAAECGADLTAEPVAISEVLKNIDQCEAEGGDLDIPGLTSESIRLESVREPAYVEFVNKEKGKGFQGSVLGVRRTIKRRELGQFVGARSELQFQFGSGSSEERTLGVILNGEGNDVEIPKAAQATQIWAILEILLGNQTLKPVGVR